MSWNPPRRSHHWSNRATLKMRARIGGQRGQDDGQLHGQPTRLGGGRSPGADAGLVGRDEAQEQPVEEHVGVVDEGRQMGRVERPTPAQPGDLGQERLAGRDEPADRLGQARARGRRALPVAVDDVGRRGLGRRPGGGIVDRRIEIGDEGGDEPPALLAVGRPIDRPLRRVDARVLASVDPVQAGGRGAEVGQRTGRASPARSRVRRVIVRRSKRRWPPGVVHDGTRPSSAQRRRVSGSTPSIRLAGPRDSQGAGSGVAAGAGSSGTVVSVGRRRVAGLGGVAGDPSTRRRKSR